jgi:hypothetical protein
MQQRFRENTKLLCWNFVIALTASAILLSAITAQARNKSRNKDKDLVYVGTHTDHGSKGIYAYRFDAATGQLTALGLAAENEQPTFLAVDPNWKVLYAANEMDHFNGQPTGAVSAFAIDRARRPHRKKCSDYELSFGQRDCASHTGRRAPGRCL